MPETIVRHFEIQQGDDFFRTLNLTVDGEDLILDEVDNEYLVECQIRADEKQESRLLRSLSGLELVISGNDITFGLLNATTQAATWKLGFYAVRITSPESIVTTLMKGTIKIRPTVIA